MLTDPRNRPAVAALAALLMVQGVMLAALLTGTPPHPPEVIPLGGMAPFLSLSMSAATAALILGADRRAGSVLSLVAVATALVSYGPHKSFDANFALVAPGVLTAQVATVTLLTGLTRRVRLIPMAA